MEIWFLPNILQYIADLSPFGVYNMFGPLWDMSAYLVLATESNSVAMYITCFASLRGMSAFVVSSAKKEFCCKLYNMFFVPLWGMSAYLVFANRMEFCVLCRSWLVSIFRRSLWNTPRGVDRSRVTKLLTENIFLSNCLCKALSMCACCIFSTC